MTEKHNRQKDLLLHSPRVCNRWDAQARVRSLELHLDLP